MNLFRLKLEHSKRNRLKDMSTEFLDSKLFIITFGAKNQNNSRLNTLFVKKLT